MSLIPVKYPLDRSGTAASNYVSDEPHQLVTANYRALVPQHGAYFTETLVLKEAGGRTLVLGTDYYPAQLYTTPTMETGKELHQLVVITNPAVSNNILFSAQMLGGEYSYAWDAIVKLIQDLRLDERTVLFESIIGRPDAYPPAPHFHDIGDVFGFEYMVAGLERIRQAILIGDAAQIRSVFDYVGNQLGAMQARIETIKDGFNSPATVIAALGYTPIKKSGDTFEGGMRFNKGITLAGYFREKVKRLTATSNQTVLPLLEANNFHVTLTTSTVFKFDLTGIPDMTGDDSLSFTLAIKNDGANHAVGFGTNVHWADKAIPPRSTGANAVDEYYFSTFNGGVTWTGSLSNVNVGQAV